MESDSIEKKEDEVTEKSKEALEDEKKPLEPLELTLRDVGVFQWAHEHRYLVYNQMRRVFWKHASVDAKACYRRIERLVNSGYLERERSRRKNIHVYMNTEKSFQVLQDRGLDSDLKLYEFSRSFESHIDHDLKVTNLRVFFRGLGLTSWTSERILHERDHILRNRPDGVLNIRGTKIAIEFENYLTKSQVRYQETLDYYSSGRDYKLVFVVIDGDMKDWLLKLNYDARRVWFVTYKDLFKNKEETVFENLREKFRLSRLLPNEG